MTPTDKIEMQVAEEQDGSAIVVMPESDEPQTEETPVESAAPAESEADDDTPDADPEREAIRQARREERQLKKKIHREKARESNQLINILKRQNEQMAERLAELERRTAGADMARLNKAIEDANLREQYAKLKVAEAGKSNDGQGLVDAQEAWFEARRNREALEALKKRATAEPPVHGVPRAPDPQMQEFASEWMNRNKWYDPNGRDTDSQIATKIDEALTAEGLDPTTEDYWEELDTRLAKYLPHRYGRQPEQQRRPRSVVTSSGRESSPASRPGEFRLSAERVNAIKQAGAWDDPVRKNKMIQEYRDYDRRNAPR